MIETIESIEPLAPFDDIQWGKVLAEAWINPEFKARLEGDPNEALREFARREFGIELDSFGSLGMQGSMVIPDAPAAMGSEYLSAGAGAAGTITGSASAGGNAQATITGSASAGGNAQATITGSASAGGNAQATITGSASAGGNAQGTITGSASAGGNAQATITGSASAGGNAQATITGSASAGGN
jgi:hypothetical protein